ncbi:hypothetical protein POVCU2_0035170 [Plasmodium ovale curtisi]|uniref:Uncharacterized protein n=1 Tax=Plasmodium ovale curtisi TaxID=864141 RepID=A0A1A8W010_PLAOA|nr:hypothetical protein POVCU2_0035170 [Plasmodium ovale curtisi]SBS96416.1 hypothetical protein POVCU1_032400 [Plasmodium ovale curtisi]
MCISLSTDLKTPIRNWCSNNAVKKCLSNDLVVINTEKVKKRPCKWQPSQLCHRENGKKKIITWIFQSAEARISDTKS